MSTATTTITDKQAEYLRGHRDNGAAPVGSSAGVGTTLLRDGLLAVADRLPNGEGGRVVISDSGREALNAYDGFALVRKSPRARIVGVNLPDGTALGHASRVPRTDRWSAFRSSTRNFVPSGDYVGTYASPERAATALVLDDLVRQSGMTRADAERILEEREGWPIPENEHLSDAYVIRAALAPEGQPCSDCGDVVVWDEEGVQDWRHATTPTGCFLARRDER